MHTPQRHSEQQYGADCVDTLAKNQKPASIETIRSMTRREK